MPALSLRMNLEEQPWDDLREAANLQTAELEGAGVLPGGMSSGLPSVALRFRLTDGTPVIAQTSLQLLLNAANAFRVHYNMPVGTWRE